MKRLSQSILVLIAAAEKLGLNEEDVKIATEIATYYEFGLAFDQIVTQMFEYEIEIDNNFYLLLTTNAQMMNLEEDEYVCMKDLIRENGNVPQ
ncbi:hypothetical protein [Dyadobacter sp. 22481]|uniref:hypothetical protein n=1 Tax=Dyadobacter sp. 22481 TaxID=3453926 RepID=UPI003F86D52D